MRPSFFFLWNCNNPNFDQFSFHHFNFFCNFGISWVFFHYLSSHSTSFQNILHLSFWINVFSFSLEPLIFHTMFNKGKCEKTQETKCLTNKCFGLGWNMDARKNQCKHLQNLHEKIKLTLHCKSDVQKVNLMHKMYCKKACTK